MYTVSIRHTVAAWILFLFVNCRGDSGDCRGFNKTTCDVTKTCSADAGAAWCPYGTYTPRCQCCPRCYRGLGQTCSLDEKTDSRCATPHLECRPPSDNARNITWTTIPATVSSSPWSCHEISTVDHDRLKRRDVTLLSRRVRRDHIPGCNIMRNCHYNAMCNHYMAYHRYKCDCKPGFHGDGVYRCDPPGCRGDYDCPTGQSCRYSVRDVRYRCRPGPKFPTYGGRSYGVGAMSGRSGGYMYISPKRGFPYVMSSMPMDGDPPPPMLPAAPYTGEDASVPNSAAGNARKSPKKVANRGRAVVAFLCRVFKLKCKISPRRAGGKY